MTEDVAGGRKKYEVTGLRWAVTGIRRLEVGDMVKFETSLSISRKYFLGQRWYMNPQTVSVEDSQAVSYTI